MDRKRSAIDDAEAKEPPAVVSPEKPKKKPRNDEEDDVDRVTGDTVMGFPKYPNATNRELMTEHRDFVRWARRKDDSGEAYGNLERFIEWVNSPEGQEMEATMKGKEIFTFGKHKGKTFEEIADSDPDYHVRFEYILKKKGQSPDGMLASYIAWFNSSGRRAPHTNLRPSGAAHAFHASFGEEKFTMGLHKGQTFRQVARIDPSYHLRCEATGQSLDGQLNSYVRYFDQYGDHNAAHEGEMDTLASCIGIVRPCWYD